MKLVSSRSRRRRNAEDAEEEEENSKTADRVRADMRRDFFSPLYFFCSFAALAAASRLAAAAAHCRTEHAPA